MYLQKYIPHKLFVQSIGSGNRHAIVDDFLPTLKLQHAHVVSTLQISQLANQLHAPNQDIQKLQVKFVNTTTKFPHLIYRIGLIEWAHSLG